MDHLKEDVMNHICCWGAQSTDTVSRVVLIPVSGNASDKMPKKAGIGVGQNHKTAGC